MYYFLVYTEEETGEISLSARRKLKMGSRDGEKGGAKNFGSVEKGGRKISDASLGGGERF